ncbi:MAG: 4Fe-4S binding protein [Dehalococcoidia bacterium]|nr:4Fe-4S binding protein [Dehalococcoidia bacterium]
MTTPKIKQPGCIEQRDSNYLTLRTRVLAGLLSCEQMAELMKVAEEYGRGVVQLTSRVGVEIPWIKAEDVKAISTRLAKVNLPVSGTGSTVRAIVACKGTTCKNGLFDTQQLCRELDQKFFGKKLSAKFKMRIAGCPNNCVMGRTNDLDFIGQCVPHISDSCSLCGSCVEVCPGKAIREKEGAITIIRSQCFNCGKCAMVCPEGAISSIEQGVAVFIGGKFGKQYRIGQRIEGVFPIEKAVEVADRLIRYYEDHAKPGERFGDTLDRVGVDRFPNRLTVRQ